MEVFWQIVIELVILIINLANDLEFYMQELARLQFLEINHTSDAFFVVLVNSYQVGKIYVLATVFLLDNARLKDLFR